jgi:hypothetical protein
MQQQQLRVCRAAYQEGFSAGYDDAGYQNPYEPGTEAHEDYKAGYEDGESEANEEKGISYLSDWQWLTGEGEGIL